jgi:putative endonuclease
LTGASDYFCEMMGTFLDWLRHIARRRRWNADLATGRRGEDLAHRYLRREGFTVVARNYRLAAGDAEADLIAWEGEHLVFVEVKSRGSEDYGPAERAVGEEKRAHLRRVAREYARKTDTPWERIRFDVVTVVFDQPPRIQLFRSAFSN